MRFGARAMATRLETLQKEFASQAHVFVGLPHMNDAQKAQLASNLQVCCIGVVPPCARHPHG